MAKEHGISDVALAKICRKLSIPRPGRGYWARRAAGKAVKVKALPPLPDGKPAEHTVSRWHDPLDDYETGDEALALLAREDEPGMAIAVPETLVNSHRWVRKSAGALRKHSKNPSAIFLKQACLDVRASRNTIERALLVTDTLLKALEHRGFRVEVTDPVLSKDDLYRGSAQTEPSTTGVHILGSFIAFGIEEGVDVTKLEPKPVRRRSSFSSDSWTYTPPPEYKRDPNGRLALKIRSHIPGQTRSTWSDGKRQRVEHCLNAFVLALIRGAERLRVQDLETERRKREWEEEQRRRQLETERRELETARRTKLDAWVAAWKKGATILEFLASLEQRAHNERHETDLNSDLGQWLQWARQYANALMEDAIYQALDNASPQDPEQER